MGLGRDGAGLIFINYIMSQLVHVMFNVCLNVLIIFCKHLTFISFKFYLLIEKKNKLKIQLDIVALLLYVHEYLNKTQNIMDVFIVFYFDDL